MGTRSTIAIKNEDGSVTGIYCHWDGYLSHNGEILNEHYTNESIVRELIGHGDVSSLGVKIGTKHNFDEAPRDECNFYGRDRGETNIDARTYKDWQELLNEFGQEYNYLFTPGTGWQVEYYGRLGNLEMEIAEEKAAEEAE